MCETYLCHNQNIIASFFLHFVKIDIKSTTCSEWIVDRSKLSKNNKWIKTNESEASHWRNSPWQSVHLRKVFKTFALHLSS